MSYAVAAPLQRAVFACLTSDSDLRNLVGDAVYDAVPSGSAPSLYVSLGPEEARDSSDKSGPGTTHDFIISVVTEEAGFYAAKRAAGAVSNALLRGGLELERARLVFLYFVSARAGRLRNSTQRRIDLRFRARVEE